MDYAARRVIPYIPPSDYDRIATEFLEEYYPDALKNLCLSRLRKLQHLDLVFH